MATFFNATYIKQQCNDPLFKGLVIRLDGQRQELDIDFENYKSREHWTVTTDIKTELRTDNNKITFVHLYAGSCPRFAFFLESIRKGDEITFYSQDNSWINLREQYGFHVIECIARVKRGNKLFEYLICQDLIKKG